MYPIYIAGSQWWQFLQAFDEESHHFKGDRDLFSYHLASSASLKRFHDIWALLHSSHTRLFYVSSSEVCFSLGWRPALSAQTRMIFILGRKQHTCVHVYIYIYIILICRCSMYSTFCINLSTCIKVSRWHWILPTGSYFLWIFHPGEWRSRLHEGCLLHRHRRFPWQNWLPSCLDKNESNWFFGDGKVHGPTEIVSNRRCFTLFHKNWSKRCWWWVLKYWFYSSSQALNSLLDLPEWSVHSAFFRRLRSCSHRTLHQLWVREGGFCTTCKTGVCFDLKTDQKKVVEVRCQF